MNWQSEPTGTQPEPRTSNPTSDRSTTVRTDLREREPAAAGERLRSIGETCRELGLSTRTVRYYEELGLLPGVRRRSAGRRVYGADELERLRFIGRLKKLGLSLAEIRELNAVHGIGGSTRAMLQRLDTLLERHLAEVGSRIDELARLRDEIARYRDRVRQRATTLDRETEAGR